MKMDQRTRTYSWEDPLALRDAGAGLSGLDYLKAVLRVATAEGKLIAEGSGKLLAHGTTTCLVMKA
jgi:hypothetical protein